MHNLFPILDVSLNPALQEKKTNHAMDAYLAKPGAVLTHACTLGPVCDPMDTVPSPIPFGPRRGIAEGVFKCVYSFGHT